MFFGALDHRLHEGVSTASPVPTPLHGDMVNMEALPSVAQRRFWPSDDLGIEVADRFVMEEPKKETCVRISE